MKIGFLGVQADNANLGLCALAYSGLKLVSDLVPHDAEFIFFSANSSAEVDRMRDTLGLGHVRVSTLPLRLRDPGSLVRALHEMAACNLVLDFTGGDSFSDIYGIRRLAKKLLHKQMVLWTGTPLVLAPQTYGPLKHRISVPWFKHVVARAAQVYTRDELSEQFLSSLVRRKVSVATDVAVTLPWDQERYQFPTDGKSRVAINISGLLWNGGYTGDNQFSLRADYRKYSDELVSALLDRNYEVYLLPHVIAHPCETNSEDDVQACRELAAAHPKARFAPEFRSPVEAKSFIAKMDVLIGARMHATIAAFSSGVATIPVAYSRKFVGFFSSLGYDYLVDLTVLNTAEAVEETIANVENLFALQDAVSAGRALAQARIRVFLEGLATLV